MSKKRAIRNTKAYRRYLKVRPYRGTCRRKDGAWKGNITITPYIDNPINPLAHW